MATTIASGQTATGASSVVITNGSDMKFESTLTAGTTPTATVKIYGSVSGDTGTWVLLTTHALSGVNDYASSTVWGRWPRVYSDVTAISGTGAAVQVVAEHGMATA